MQAGRTVERLDAMRWRQARSRPTTRGHCLKRAPAMPSTRRRRLPLSRSARASAVARMKRSAIRESQSPPRNDPAFRYAPCGLQGSSPGPLQHAKPVLGAEFPAASRHRSQPLGRHPQAGKSLDCSKVGRNDGPVEIRSKADAVDAELARSDSRRAAPCPQAAYPHSCVRRRAGSRWQNSSRPRRRSRGSAASCLSVRLRE